MRSCVCFVNPRDGPSLQTHQHILTGAALCDCVVLKSSNIISSHFSIYVLHLPPHPRHPPPPTMPEVSWCHSHSRLPGFCPLTFTADLFGFGCDPTNLPKREKTLLCSLWIGKTLLTILGAWRVIRLIDVQIITSRCTTGVAFFFFFLEIMLKTLCFDVVFWQFSKLISIDAKVGTWLSSGGVAILDKVCHNKNKATLSPWLMSVLSRSCITLKRKVFFSILCSRYKLCCCQCIVGHFHTHALRYKLFRVLSRVYLRCNVNGWNRNSAWRIYPSSWPPHLPKRSLPS